MLKYIILFTALTSILYSCNPLEKHSDAKESETTRTVLFPENTKGHLFIIGGGERPDSLMTKYLALGGGNDAKVLIVPFASGEIVETGTYQETQFKAMGCNKVSYIDCPKEEIDSPESLARLDSVTAVFFSGGDQNKLTAFLKGTKFLDKIIDIYKAGGVLGGTSAGAAVMSRVMITGEEGLNGDGSGDFKVIKAGNVQTAPGFGFITSAIVDQHFIYRKRENRLITLVIENPGLKGIGIDEATAIIVSPNGTCTVAGQSSVMVFDNAQMKNISHNTEEYLSAQNISLSIYTAGQTFNL